MADVEFLAAARTDYDEAHDWYAARSLQAAAGFEAAMQSALQAVVNSPERWPSRDARHRFYGLRRYPFSIIYRFEHDRVVIVAVAHSRRRPGYWYNR